MAMFSAHGAPGYTTAIKEPGLAALESYCLTRSRSNQVFVRHHKVAQVGAALRYASTKLMADPEADRLFDFLSVLKSLANDAERESALQKYSVLDDGWWFQGLRKLQTKSDASLLSSCLSVALDRAPTLKSLWKRKGDLTTAQHAALKERVQSLTAAESGKVQLQGARQLLLDNGVLFTMFRFTPFAIDRTSKESAMLISSKNGNLVPASRLSPLIRHLESFWQEDIHFYAFAGLNNPITIDGVLDLLKASNGQEHLPEK
jgi:HD superfamily phosphohydrolase